MRLNIYLSFDGNCDEAFDFYHGVLGGERTMTQRFGGSPMAESVGQDWHDKIMHTQLTFGGMDLMGSDGMPGQFIKPQGYNVSVMTDAPEEADRIFNALAEDGEVTFPIQETFWARRFGMLNDRFGIGWMVNCN